MSFVRRLRVPIGGKFRLSRVDPESTPGVQGKVAGRRVLEKNLARIDELQYDLYAENRRSVLLVLQAMDAGGKDGLIRKLAPALNPAGCRVMSFKAPTPQELDHDFLWRIHQAVPGRGEVGIFNRSHYEDVLVVRVHDLVPKSVWSERYDQINAFERHLADNDTVIIKCMLHISRDEQKQRLEARLENPRKHWKFSTADLDERKRWDDYMDAFDEALRRCSTEWAPWYVIPANNKWYRDAAVSQILRETLEKMKIQFPKTDLDVDSIRID
jgi:PPK2 family polyphosphate:nucleotide phosphotransferase